MSDGPPGGAGDKTQLLLLVEAIHFIHHAVDFVFQFLAALTDVFKVLQTAFYAFDCFNFRRHPQPPVTQLFQHFAVTTGK